MQRLDLSDDEYLVLFECLYRMCETESVAIDHAAEVAVFDTIAGQLERQLGEPFQQNYRERLAAARSEVLQAHRERFGDDSWIERVTLGGEGSGEG